MAGDNPVIPNLSKIIKTTIEKTQPEETVGARTERDWVELGKTPMWKNTAKPYLEDRQKVLKSMTDINLSGRETPEEVGIRFLICSAIAHELQSFIDRVEISLQVSDKKVEEEKKVAQAKIKKVTVTRKKKSKKGVST